MLEWLAAAAAARAKQRAAAAVVRNRGPILWALVAVVAILVLFVSAFVSATGGGIAAGAQVDRPVALDTSCGTNAQPAVALSAQVPAEYAALISRASSSCAGALPAPMMAAQVWAESNFRPTAGSPVGARGLVQFMPATWAAHGIDGDGDGRADITNPVDNAMSAAKYICDLRLIVRALGLSGDETDLTLAAYNAGIGNVKKYRGVPPFTETRNYITKIRERAKLYAGENGVGVAAASIGAACTTIEQVASSGGWAQPMKAGSYRLSSGFGPRSSPGGVGSTNHAGTDLAAPIGTPIYAIAAGTVLKAGAASGYGQAVYITSAGGFISRYGHVSAFHVKAGDVVKAGQLIADVGNEGRSTGPHLHLECRPNDRPVNCVPYLRERGINL